MHEYEAEFDSEITISYIYNALKDHYEVMLLEADQNFVWVSRVLSEQPAMVFNICEGFHGPARESVYAALIEQLGIRYSGPDSTNLLVCHNKSMVKKILDGQVRTPKGYALQKADDLKQLPKMPYPVIVKLNSEGSSIGLSRESIVYSETDLIDRATLLLNRYKSNVLIEEYIDGIDLSMIYVEGIGIMGPCTIDCDAEFYDYEMKTVKDDTVDITTNTGEYKELYDTVNTIVRKLDIKGYAKIDFRVKDDKYYLIEVNAQVSFHPYGEFATCVRTNGFTLENVIRHIVNYEMQKQYKENSLGIGENYGYIN